MRPGFDSPYRYQHHVQPEPGKSANHLFLSGLYLLELNGESFRLAHSKKARRPADAAAS